MARRNSGGRYSVGEATSNSLNCIIARGMHMAAQRKEAHTLYVRELGQMAALRIIERDDNGVVRLVSHAS